MIRGTEGNIKGQYVKIIRNFRALEEKNSLVERGPFLYVNDKIVYSGAKKKSQKCSVPSLEQTGRWIHPYDVLGTESFPAVTKEKVR